MMKKAKRMLAYLIVLVMCVDMVSQSSFISRAQEATEKTEGTAAVEKPAEKATDQQTASSTESAASEPKEAGAENGVVGTTTGTQSAVTEVPKTENASEEQSDEKTTGETTGDQKAELTEEEKAAADLVSRIEQALAGIPDQGSLKGTEEEMEALNKQGQNLQDLYEECNEYKDIKEVAAVQESLAQAITRLQELMGLSAEMLAACGENCTHVAAIGDTHFDTLQDAINAVATKDTKEITLLRDVTVDSTAATNQATLDIPAGVTLDGNGKTITAGTFAEAHMLGVTNAAGVTIKNLTVDMNKAVNSTSKHALNVFGATASVTLENVTLKNANTAGMVVNAGTANVTGLKSEGNGWGAVNVDKSGKLTIDTIADLAETPKVWSECTLTTTGSTVNINGTHVKFKVASWDANADNGKGGKGVYKYKMHYALNDSEMANHGVCVTTRDDGNRYVCDTLPRGVAHTLTGGVLNVIKNHAVASGGVTISKNMTLDLNRKTLVVNGNLVLNGKNNVQNNVQNNVLKNGTVIINNGMVVPVLGASLRMENVSLTGNSGFAVQVGNDQNDTAALEIVDCTIEKTGNGHGAAIGIYGKSTLNIEGKSTIIGSSWGIMGNGGTNSKKEVPATTITLGSGVTVTAKGGMSTWNGTGTPSVLGSSGIYHPQTGVLTTSANIRGMFSGIEMRSGSLIVNGGTIEATTDTFSCHPEGSGMTTLGAAIAIAQHTTKKDISVTINSGIFKGIKALNESNPQKNDPKPQVTISVMGGVFQGEISVDDVTGFISGGTFKGRGLYSQGSLISYLKSGFVLNEVKGELFTLKAEAKVNEVKCAHKYVESLTATCTAEGNKTLTCIFCGDGKAEKIAELGHSWLNGICTRCKTACSKHNSQTNGHCGECGVKIVQQITVKEVSTEGTTKKQVEAPVTSTKEKKEYCLVDNTAVNALVKNAPANATVTLVTEPIKVDESVVNEQNTAVRAIREEASKPEIKEKIKSEILKVKPNLDETKKYEVAIRDCLDINLYLNTTTETTSKPISETEEVMLSFEVQMPEGSSGTENFVILRDHNGQVDVLSCIKNGEKKTLTFETNKFSVYAIATYEVAATTPSGGNNGGGSGSSNDNSQPTQAAPIISVEPAIMEAAPAAAPTNAAAVPPQPVEEEKKTQVPALKEDKTAKRKETTFGDGVADDLVTIENDDTPLAIGKTESNWLIWILSGMSVLFAAAFVGFELLTKKRRDEE